jgi:acetolactate synthase-1/2/3 large subunit
MKYSDQFVDWLCEEGYTHCFYVAGGNIMHLLNSVRTRMVCVPFVHEVGAGIAAEYFNESNEDGGGRAFALVTAGPGLTNILTAIAGAYLESRDLLVVGGQVKSDDLTTGGLRQRGIQEIDGMALAQPITVKTLRIREPLGRTEIVNAVREGRSGRKGPVFIDFCLDAQGAPPVEESITNSAKDQFVAFVPEVDSNLVTQVVQLLSEAERPLILLGGGVSRKKAEQILPVLEKLGVPISTSWNAADRIGSEHPLYFGRPNTWGMRWSNVLIQQADLVLALGTRLGLQQTGFNWQKFAPLAKVVQVDIDEHELLKGHPVLDIAVRADASEFLELLTTEINSEPDGTGASSEWEAWVKFGSDVAGLLPTNDSLNTHTEGFVDPYEFIQILSAALEDNDVIIPCSSGGAFTVMMQAFAQKDGQRIITNKGLASMGYGLSGAIGAALANKNCRTILVEGDGGFAQNLQELGTVAAQQLNLKIFIFANSGYASIRMTQRNYFEGAYMGCDTSTGLGLPDWDSLFKAYRIPVMELNATIPLDENALQFLLEPGPAAFIVPIDPEQTYFPKISSRITKNGTMESNPLHLMHPPLSDQVRDTVMPYLEESFRYEQN